MPLREKEWKLPELTKRDGPMNWYVQAFQKYAEFNGRSTRSEYGYFILLHALVIMGIILIELVFGTNGILGALYALGAIVPSFAVAVRRLHETGRSGWSILLVLIPVIGAVILLIFLLQRSQYGENRYEGWVKEGERVLS